jgi:hypothetical protein
MGLNCETQEKFCLATSAKSSIKINNKQAIKK